MENKFLENYFREIRELISDSSKVINDLIDVKKTILLASKRGKNIFIVGNGGRLWILRNCKSLFCRLN